ncbi:unnamed protein product [Closterium sp. NIES-64]|nr:unnamed protein product [Closterium sp. NIES-64]
MSVIKSASSPRPPGKLELADDATLKAHVTAAFDEVDAHKSGKVSRAELRPAFLRLARLAGLPELGGSSELDRAVDEAFETGEGDETGELGKDHFVALSLGLLNVVKIVAAYAARRCCCRCSTCGAMRHSPPSAEQRAEAALAEAAFKQMDKGGRGKLSKRDLLPVLATLGIQGSPPQVAEATLAALLEKYVGGAEEMGASCSSAPRMPSSPVPPFPSSPSLPPPLPTPTPCRTCLPSHLLAPRQILASNEPLQKMVSETFADLDVSKAGQLSRADLMSGLRQWLTVWLTPQQVDSLLSHHFPAADVDSSDSVDRGKFSTLFPRAVGVPS